MPPKSGPSKMPPGDDSTRFRLNSNNTYSDTMTGFNRPNTGQTNNDPNGMNSMINTGQGFFPPINNP